MIMENNWVIIFEINTNYFIIYILYASKWANKEISIYMLQ